MRQISISIWLVADDIVGGANRAGHCFVGIGTDSVRGSDLVHDEGIKPRGDARMIPGDQSGLIELWI